MIDHQQLAATFDTTLAEFGSQLTLVGQPTPSNPVTGEGGSSGAQRTALGALTDVDFSVFPESRVRSTDQQIVFASNAEVRVGERWAVTADSEYTIEELQVIKPNNKDVLGYIALVRA